MDNKTLFLTSYVLLLDIKYYPFISSHILGCMDPYIKISVLTSLYVWVPKKEENRNFLPLIWFSLLQAGTSPCIKKYMKKNQTLYLYLHNGKGPSFPCWTGCMILRLTSTLWKVSGTIIFGQTTSVLLPNLGKKSGVQFLEKQTEVWIATRYLVALLCDCQRNSA